MDNDKHSKDAQANGDAMSMEAVENSRRNLMTKLAAGAFAVPAVLASISSQAAAASITPPPPN